METCPRCGNELRYSDDCVESDFNESPAVSGVAAVYVEELFCSECFFTEIIDFCKVKVEKKVDAGASLN